VSDSFACVGFGYDDGEVSCTDDCLYDFRDCFGVERCFDAADNDGDGDEDCEDDDCSEACASSCDEIAELGDPASVIIDNTGHASELDLSCGAGVGAGPELVYRVEIATTGMLDATVDSGGFPEISVSLRTTCEDDDSELVCANARASAPVSQGDVVYVVVQGSSDVDVGNFQLFVQSRSINVCGDGFWDGQEACDDSNRDDDDGCTASCNVELTETEPNQDAGEADSYESPFYGEISPQGDIDVVAIEVVDDDSYLIANTFTLVSGGCTFESFDPFLQLLDVDGSTVLVDNDDYDGACSRVLFEGLAAGTYYLVVRESSNSVGARSEFPYRLGVTVDSCGNGARGPLEECDDGNTDDGDGCSSGCEAE
jgi:cysteine-rich repeat protein